MISADTFLRRCLLAPLLVPLIAWIGYLARIEKLPKWMFHFDPFWFLSANPLGKPHGVWEPYEYGLLIVLGLSLCYGAPPYLMTIAWRWRKLATKTGTKLQDEIIRLPLWMLVVDIIFLIALGLSAWGCALAGYESLTSVLASYTLIGAVGFLAIPILGGLYVAVFLLALHTFQSLGLVGPTTNEARSR